MARNRYRKKRKRHPNDKDKVQFIYPVERPGGSLGWKTEMCIEENAEERLAELKEQVYGS